MIHHIPALKGRGFQKKVIEKIKEKYVVDYMGYFLRDMVIVEPIDDESDEDED